MDTLTQSTVNLYSFINNVFFDDKRLLRRRITRREENYLIKQGIKATMVFDYIEEHVKNFVDKFFLEFKVDTEIFDEFNDNQKQRLIGLNRELDTIKQETINNIVDVVFRVSKKKSRTSKAHLKLKGMFQPLKLGQGIL